MYRSGVGKKEFGMEESKVTLSFHLHAPRLRKGNIHGRFGWGLVRGGAVFGCLSVGIGLLCVLTTQVG